MKVFGNLGQNNRQFSNILNLVWRLMQAIAAAVVIGYYASDVNASKKPNKYSDSRWVFAVVVGSMSLLTAVVYAGVGFLQYRAIAFLFAWDWVLTILWAAVSGLFCSMFLNNNDGGQRMRVAAGFDLASLILWGISAIAGTIVFFRSGRRSSYTGRAEL